MEKNSIEIIGYGSMGKMLFEKYSCQHSDLKLDVFVTNRNIEKLVGLSEKFICSDNLKLAEKSDVICNSAFHSVSVDRILIISSHL